MQSNWRAYYCYFRPQLGLFWASMAAALVYAVATGFGISYLLERVLPSLFAEEAEALPLPALIGVTSLIPLAFVFRGVAGWFHVTLINAVGLRALELLRAAAFDKIQRLQLGFIRKRPSGDLLSRLSNDTQLLQTTLTNIASDIVKQPLTLLAALSYLVYASMRQQEIVFVLASVLAVPICILPVRYLGRKLLKRARQQQEQLGDLTALTAENLNGALEIRAFNLEDRQSRAFSEQLRRLVRTQLKVVRYLHALNPSVEFIAACGIAAAFATSYLKGVSLESFMALMPALYFSYEPVKRIGAIHTKMQRARGALERIDVIFQEPLLVRDPEKPQTPTVLDEAGPITFENVSFQYEDVPVLRGLNLRIEPGTFNAIVGPSGAGKSTFISLLPRFFDPTEGRIRWGELDIRAFRLADLRSMVAIVPQDPFLFRDTLLNNIRLGRLEASDEEVFEAARRAYIHEFIISLPNGYETQAGERGSQLSGGQRQRIALARAFLRDAPVLILDEATSALDTESEQKIQAAFERLIRGKTVFVVAHRFSTIRAADRLILFEEGRITATGDIDELKRHRTFKRLYDSQGLG